jgi:hypothetical protein
MTWSRSSLALLLGVVPVCACGPYAAETARATAARDLSCPADQVEAYSSVGGRYVARGCGHWVEYVCLTNAGPYRRATVVCFPPAQPEVH